VRPVSLWAGRLVLCLAGLLLLRVGLGLVADPVHAVTEQGIALPSASAITSMRAIGGAFLAVGFLLLGSLVAARWIRSGLILLLTFAGLVTAGRLLGLALDGPAPFTLKVLKPEIGLVLISSLALLASFWRPPVATCGPTGTDERGGAWKREDALG
jgi:hypothetical protein